jgi:AcrR family transcriptional regulator
VDDYHSDAVMARLWMGKHSKINLGEGIFLLDARARPHPAAPRERQESVSKTLRESERAAATPAANQTAKQTGKPAVARGSEPQQDRSVRTKAQVLAAAAELFAERGFRGTNIQDVADRVSMTKGAVYFHFPNKDSLAVGVVEAHYNRWPAILENVRDEEMSPLDAVERMFDRAAVAFRDDPIIQGGARLQIERDYIDAALPEPYIGWMARVAAMLWEARDCGELREGVDPDAAARYLVAAFFGVQHVSEILHHRADLLDRWAEMRELTFAALRK